MTSQIAPMGFAIFVLVALFIIALVIGVVLLLVGLTRQNRRSAALSDQEREVLERTAQTLARLEGRVDNLETVLMKQGREKPE